MNSSRPLSMAKIKGACYLAPESQDPMSQPSHCHQVSHHSVLDHPSSTCRITMPSYLQVAGYSPLLVWTVPFLGTGTGKPMLPFVPTVCTHPEALPHSIPFKKSRMSYYIDGPISQKEKKKDTKPLSEASFHYAKLTGSQTQTACGKYPGPSWTDCNKYHLAA